MRELTIDEIKSVDGGAYAERHQVQFRNMMVTAIGGAILSGPAGFAVGLVVGAITSYSAR